MCVCTNFTCIVYYLGFFVVFIVILMVVVVLENETIRKKVVDKLHLSRNCVEE